MTPETEREFWDSKTLTEEDARLAIWAEPGDPESWERDVEPCLEAIVDSLNLHLSGRVLDLGCGMGRLTLPLADSYPDHWFVGIDISPGMIERARAAALPNTSFVVGNGRDLIELATNSFTAAYSMITFQHIPCEAVIGYIAEVARVLVTGGRFRFQYVEGDTDSFLQHDCHEADVVEWCEQEGLKVIGVDHGLLSPVWAWVTAVKQ